MAVPSNERLPVVTAAQATTELVRSLKSRPLLAIGAALALLAGAALAVVPVLLLGRIVDLIRAGNGAQTLPGLLSIIIACALGAGLLNGLGHTLLGTLAARVVAELRERVTHATLSLPVATLENAGRGDTLSRVGPDVAVLSSASRGALPTVLGASLMIFVALVGMATLDVRLALAGMAAGPMYVLAVRWYLPRAAPRYRELRRLEAEYLNDVVGTVEAVHTLRSYGLEKQRRHQLTNSAAAVRRQAIDSFSVFTRFVARENRAEFIGLAALILMGWLLLRADHVTVGDVAAATLLFHRLFTPIGAVLAVADDIQKAGAALVRLVGVMRLAGHAEPAQPGREKETAVEIRVHGLHHRYPAAEHPAVDGVDLHIPAGATLALVGATGAGKTTLASLLAGSLHPTEGEITLNGRSIAEFDESQLRALVSVATQESHVFAGTLRDDLRLADPTADDTTLHDALKTVGAQEWMQTLPEGLDTRVGEGGLIPDPALAQQLALARILVRDTPVVVLDEATAEAGSAEAGVLEAASQAVTAGRTAVVVAHRLDQVCAADAIAVMADGRVIEHGTHEQLLAAGGRYAELWDAWSTGREEEMR
ncbi:ABC transporter ATP-binding protein [Dermatophilus congolensis]|uniref:ABC transporter ATP-binding protein n=1 Tax=Dermatophilus congolensis TaxID=1863 RepID=UPI001AAEF6AE